MEIVQRKGKPQLCFHTITKKRSMTKSNTSHERGKMIMSVCLAIFGCILMLAGFIVPPTGVIHNSVLIGAGEVFTFSGSLLGIILKYDINLQRLSSEIDERIKKKLNEDDDKER